MKNVKSFAILIQQKKRSCKIFAADTATSDRYQVVNSFARQKMEIQQLHWSNTESFTLFPSFPKYACKRNTMYLMYCSPESFSNELHSAGTPFQILPLHSGISSSLENAISNSIRQTIKKCKCWRTKMATVHIFELVMTCTSYVTVK